MWDPEVIAMKQRALVKSVYGKNKKNLVLFFIYINFISMKTTVKCYYVEKF